MQWPHAGKRAGAMKLRDQVAIVTGAGRNIGEEIAKLFAVEGARVAVVDMDAARGGRVAAGIRQSGGDAQLFLADVSRGSDVAELVRAVVARFGRIDILVNNVAISDNKHILDISEEEWDRVLAVTLKSQFLMGKHVAAQMVAQGTGGRIVNIGSPSGFLGRRRQPPPRHGCTAGAAQDPGERHRAEQDRLARGQGRVRSDPPGAEHGQAPGRSEGSSQGRAVPGERRFILRIWREPVRGRRRLRDGSVVMRRRMGCLVGFGGMYRAPAADAGSLALRKSWTRR